MGLQRHGIIQQNPSQAAQGLCFPLTLKSVGCKKALFFSKAVRQGKASGRASGRGTGRGTGFINTDGGFQSSAVQPEAGVEELLQKAGTSGMGWGKAEQPGPGALFLHPNQGRWPRQAARCRVMGSRFAGGIPGAAFQQSLLAGTPGKHQPRPWGALL